MELYELLILAVGLAMDAFAVAVCKGLATDKLKIKHMAIVGLWFGGFQALMPAVGYFFGDVFGQYITAIDHWIAFVLLVIIGGNMIKEAFSGECSTDGSLGFKVMLTMAVATSIDALAVGVSFAFLKVQIVPAITFIGVITFVLSAIGVVVGNIFGARFKSKAELTGGIVLIAMGTKILIEHLFFS